MQRKNSLLGKTISRDFVDEQGATEWPGKCLETGKWQNPLLEQNRYPQGATERPGKCLETGKWQNPLLEQKRHPQGGTEWPFRCLDLDIYKA